MRLLPKNSVDNELCWSQIKHGLEVVTFASSFSSVITLYIMLKSGIYKITDNPPVDFFGTMAKKLSRTPYLLAILERHSAACAFELMWSVTQVLHNNCDGTCAMKRQASGICSNL